MATKYVWHTHNFMFWEKLTDGRGVAELGLAGGRAGILISPASAPVKLLFNEGPKHVPRNQHIFADAGALPTVSPNPFPSSSHLNIFKK